MGLYNLVRSKGYKQFMAKLYGWGAAVVLMGALFKINHYPGANIMLIIGLGTEALIFFMSAFEPLHVEYDWSLVYPELAGMEEVENQKTITQRLDKMLEEAKIGPDLINSLGEGMRNLSDNAMKISGVTEAASATDGYVNNLNIAADSVKNLSDVYVKSAEVLERDVANAELHSTSMKMAAESASKLSDSYSKVSDVLTNDVNASEQYVNSIMAATASANNLTEKYTQSAETLSKIAGAIDFTEVDSKEYAVQVQKISKNLADLNSIYELQLRSTSEQLQKTDMVKETIDQFLGNLNDSVENTVRYKDQVAVLAQNIAALNQVYGKMLSAMNYQTQV
jgi:gliding motility-associated protein GldL